MPSSWKGNGSRGNSRWLAWSVVSRSGCSTKKSRSDSLTTSPGGAIRVRRRARADSWFSMLASMTTLGHSSIGCCCSIRREAGGGTGSVGRGKQWLITGGRVSSSGTRSTAGRTGSKGNRTVCTAASGGTRWLVIPVAASPRSAAESERTLVLPRGSSMTAPGTRALVTLRFLDRRSDPLEGLREIDRRGELFQPLPQGVGIGRIARMRSYANLPHGERPGR